MRETMNAMKPHCLAKALYDNIAETPEELAFRRGDVLTILEKDTNGLEGWWLCGLRGKQGIAPGNRLKPLMGMHDASIYDAPPSQSAPDTQPQWNRRSWDVLPDKVVTPHKIGEVYVYDQPNKGYQDYDVPPSRYFPTTGQDGGQDCEGNYSVPNSISPEEPAYSIPPSRGDESVYSTPSSLPTSSKRLTPERDVYDRPVNHGVSLSNASLLDVYDRPNPSSNRSSTISMLSTGSTNCSSEASSAPQSGSARSSTDISYHDLYDIPPPLDPRGNMKKSNSEPLLDIYDSPPSVKQQQRGDNDYDHPPTLEEGIYSTPPPPKAIKGNLNKGHSLQGRPEDEEASLSVSKMRDLYDSGTLKKENSTEDIYATTPRNTPVKLNTSSYSAHDPNHVYDVPPQVTKDTETPPNLSMKLSRNSADSLDEKFSRLSTGSDDSRGSALDIGSVTYEELPIDLDAAMELLVRLQQDVHKSTSRLLSFVSSTWRTKEKLEPRIYDIKLACMGVKTSLQEFLDFAQGALANSAKVSDKTLAKKLHTQLVPLQEARQSIGTAMRNLDTIKWQVANLLSSEESSADSLGQIVSSSKELSSDVRKLGSFIQGNSTLLFKRLGCGVGGGAGTMEPAERDESGKAKQMGRPLPPVPATGQSPGNAVPNDKSPLSPVKSPGPKPPLKPKPKVAGKPDMAGRPLPAPPPPASTPPQRPRSQQEQQLPLKPVGSGVKAYHKLPSQGIVDEGGTGRFLEDYDYVHLESAEVREQRQQQEQFLEEQAEEKKRDFTPKQKAQIQLLEKEVQREIDTDITKFKEERRTSQLQTQLDPNDKQLLLFYAEQVMSHSTLLTNAIDAFLGGIEYNQPPKVFIAHSKFVVLGAHKLVYIGDTLHRNVMNTDIRNKIMHCANYLCDCLKATVTATKTAALQYPSLTAVQEMVDRVVDVSHAAHELKLVITQAAAL